MRKYTIMYKDVKIGNLTVEENRYIYTPDEIGIATVEQNGITILNHMKKFIDQKTIPFFESRIQNSKRFKGLSIGYHTDGYEIIEE